MLRDTWNGEYDLLTQVCAIPKVVQLVNNLSKNFVYEKFDDSFCISSYLLVSRRKTVTVQNDSSKRPPDFQRFPRLRVLSNKLDQIGSPGNLIDSGIAKLSANVRSVKPNAKCIYRVLINERKAE